MTQSRVSIALYILYVLAALCLYRYFLSIDFQGTASNFYPADSKQLPVLEIIGRSLSAGAQSFSVALQHIFIQYLLVTIFFVALAIARLIKTLQVFVLTGLCGLLALVVHAVFELLLVSSVLHLSVATAFVVASFLLIYCHGLFLPGRKPSLKNRQS